MDIIVHKGHTFCNACMSHINSRFLTYCIEKNMFYNLGLITLVFGTLIIVFIILFSIKYALIIVSLINPRQLT